MNRHRTLFATFAVALLLVACSPRGPLRSFNVGDELAFYSFDRAGDFEQGTYGVASLLIRDGVYRIDVREGDNELWWGQWGETYGDVVIDVDVEQLSERNENAYGVMCRVRGHVGQPIDVSGLATDEPATEAAETPEVTAEAGATETEQATAEVEATVEATEIAEEAETEAAADGTDAGSGDEATPQVTAEATRETASGTVLETGSGDGYLFLIQGGGSYAIMRARGRDLTPLVDWQTSDAINVGPAENHLRAVCVGDYLAFYVNDVLVADTTDDTFQSGQVGLAASAATRLGVRVEFDNLSVKAATAG